MSEENKKFDVSFEDNKLHMSIDSNQDGEKLVNINVDLGEAIQEIFKRGEKVENAKLVDYEISASKLVLKLDTDKDGEKLLDIEISLKEALDESGILK